MHTAVTPIHPNAAAGATLNSSVFTSAPAARSFSAKWSAASASATLPATREDMFSATYAASCRIYSLFSPERDFNASNFIV